MHVINVQVRTLLEKLTLLCINALSKLFECLHHIVLCDLRLFRYISPFLFQPLFLNSQLVALACDLRLQFLDRLDDLRVGLFEQRDVVSLVLAVDNAL